MESEVEQFSDSNMLEKSNCSHSELYNIKHFTLEFTKDVDFFKCNYKLLEFIKVISIHRIIFTLQGKKLISEKKT